MTSRTPIRLTPYRGPLATPSTSPESNPALSTPPTDIFRCSTATRPTLDVATLQHRISTPSPPTRHQFRSHVHRRRRKVTSQGRFGRSTHLSPLNLVLDFIPGSHQYLLTILSVWWTLGQLICSLIAWPLIAKFSCATSEKCERSNNMGWRYLLFTLGELTFFLLGLRFFVFALLKSSRFLSGIGKDAEAVDVIHKLAKYNDKTTMLTVEEPEPSGRNRDASPSRMRRDILSKDSKFGANRIKALFVFATPEIAWCTGLLIAVWGIIDLASTLYNSFLPYLLSTRGAVFGDGSLYIIYRNQVILSTIGVPAAFLAGWAAEASYVRCTGSLAISSALTGAFLCASTTSRTSNQLLGWNCGYACCSNMMYGVLYAVSPEIFPAKDRGTGNGLTATAGRVFGVMAPVIALYANVATAVPVYVAGGMIVFAGFLALLLPYEPRGKAYDTRDRKTRVAS